MAGATKFQPHWPVSKMPSAAKAPTPAISRFSCFVLRVLGAGFDELLDSALPERFSKINSSLSLAARLAASGPRLAAAAQLTGRLQPRSEHGLAAHKSTSTMSTRIRLLLPRFILPFLAYGESGNCSLELSRSRQTFDHARGVAQHRRQGRRLLKGAIPPHHAATRGHTLETAGSTCDLISLGKAPHQSREIDAKVSPRDHDRQETSVLEAKYARAGHNWKIKVIRAGASAGRPGRKSVSA